MDAKIEKMCVDSADRFEFEFGSDFYEARKAHFLAGKKGLSRIIENLKEQQSRRKCDTQTSEALESSPQTTTTQKSRRRRLDRSNGIATPTDYTLHNNNNNNNHVKNERLSPGTPDTSSRSRSVTPSSASHSGTPPAPEQAPFNHRNYSDFMRSLAAKYNNTNPNDFFGAARNGFQLPFDHRLKASFANLMPNVSAALKDESKKADFATVMNPFAPSSMFPPMIDMSATQTLLAMVKTAKEAELQGLLKNVKRQDSSSPLDLSAAAPPMKRPRTKTPSSISLTGLMTKRADSESPRLQDDVANWSVDDVCNFVAAIDICAEYVPNFREQRIDGSGLPLLTEEHLTTKMNMKLGPALKLKSVLAKKLGSCSVCLHCTHCHNSSASPEPGAATGNNSDSGGPT